MATKKPETKKPEPEPAKEKKVDPVKNTATSEGGHDLRLRD